MCDLSQFFSQSSLFPVILTLCNACVNRNVQLQSSNKSDGLTDPAADDYVKANEYQHPLRDVIQLGQTQRGPDADYYDTISQKSGVYDTIEQETGLYIYTSFIHRKR